MPEVMKTLLLNPPSFENFDGGASSRWPATREIESYWYPVWLTPRTHQARRDAECQDIDFVTRGEFDYSVTEYARGRPLGEILGVSYRKDGKIVHNPERPQLHTEELDALPFASDIYKRDLE